MKIPVPLITFLFCALVARSVFAQGEIEFEKANQEFAQGHFKEAISSYEALIRDGQ